MGIDEKLETKLEQSAAKVDSFITELTKPRRPKILYQAAMHLLDAGGKRLRPFLVLKSCEVLGGDEDDAVPFAAALEILHNFTLIHDDIMDNDEVRRGVKTVHVQWGIPVAIAAGDLLFAKVYESMLTASQKLPCDRIQACIKRVTEAAISICEGQVLDISYPSLDQVTEEDYYVMAGGKTAALFKACAEIGAIIGGGGCDEVNRMGDFAWNAGVAFQLVDDYLGVTTGTESLGKPTGSDLREGKKTLYTIHALQNASQKDKEKIKKVLSNKDASEPEIKAAEETLRKLGSFTYSLEKAEKYAQKAKNMLSSFPPSESKKDLLELIEYFTHRRY